MTFRRSCVLIHRCNGLLLAGFLTISGTTGAALAWRVPLERLSAPQLFVLEKHGSAAAHADPLLIRQRVQEAFPKARVDTVDLSSVADAPLEFDLTSQAGSDDEVFADPFTGRILGSRRYGDLRQGRVNLIPFLYRLHEDLAFGPFGATCLGLVALLWTFDCFVGIYLSFPKRFWPALKIRWSAGGFRRLYDSHRASGVWLWVLLLILAWTGVAFNLPGVYGPVMRVFGSSARQSDLQGGCRDQAESWDANLALARNLMRAQAERLHFRVKGERFLSFEPESCKWTYRVRSTLDVGSLGNTQLVWNQGRGTEAAFSAPTGTSRADTFTSWIEAIHEAQVGGPPVRWLVCLGGLVTVLLSVTGVLIFLRKMRF